MLLLQPLCKLYVSKKWRGKKFKYTEYNFAMKLTKNGKGTECHTDVQLSLHQR